MLISVPADVAGLLTVDVIAARDLVEGAEELAELPDPECAVRVVHAWWNCGRRCTVCHQAVGAATLVGIGDVGV
jgi:predicted metal-binding protein